MRRALVFAILLGAFAGCVEESPRALPEVTSAASPSPSAVPAGAGDLLYVIHSAGGGVGGSQVLVIDATTRTVLRTFPADYTPDIALSPDGHTLFLTRRVENGADVRDAADAIDTATGEVTREDVEIEGRLYYIIYPPAEDWLRVSPDGRRLYYIAYGEMKGGCGDCDSYVRAVDIATGERVRDIHLPWCAASGLEFDRSRPLLYTHCFKGQTAVVDLETGESTPLPVYGEAFDSVVDQERGWWYILSRDLRVFAINLNANVKQYPPVPGHDLPIPLGTHSFPFPISRARGGIALSPDGARLYVGIALSDETASAGQADEIWVFETHDWQPARHLTLSPPAFHFALSHDGRTIYAVNPFERAVSFVDAETGETETLTDIGVSPGKIIVSP